jgi:streptogramin lyase
MRAQRTILLAVLSFLALETAPLLGHPGVGIVMDTHGNVFYTDLARVWKISPDGRRTVAVPNVHTHELYLDAQGNLYGEHLWYEGETTNRWGHRVWRRSSEGAVTDVYGPREGFRTDYSFVRDGAGNMYWVERERGVRFRKRTTGGAVSTLAECRPCRDVRWMTAAPDGTLYFVDGTDLYEISPTGSIRLRATHLGRRTLTHPQAGDRHIVMGLWIDASRNVYAAIYGTGEVKRIARDGSVLVVATSRLPWSPSGGMIDRSGNLWLLECSITNSVRVRRIDRDGHVTVF